MIIIMEPRIPPKIPTYLYALGHERIPIPTKALNVLVNDSESLSFTMYFSECLNLDILPSNVILAFLLD